MLAYIVCITYGLSDCQFVQLLLQLIMIGAFLAYVVRKAREEFSRTVDQVRDDVSLPGSAVAANSTSKLFGLHFLTTNQTDELLVA